MDKELFDRIYEKPNSAPWTIESRLGHFDMIIEKIGIKPCTTLEVGCGEGFHAIYLAKKGFDVTAIDWSENAIKNAKDNAKKQAVSVNFKVMHWNEMGSLNQKFDFIYDWRFLHDILEIEQRLKYIESVAKMLRNGGLYFSTSYSDKTYVFGTGKIRKTPAETKCYFASKEELRDMFKKNFNIIKEGEFSIKREYGEMFFNYILSVLRILAG